MNIKFFSILLISAVLISPLCGEALPSKYNKEHPSASGSKSHHEEPLQNHAGEFINSSMLPPEGDKLYDYYFKHYTSPYSKKWISETWKRAQYFTDFIEHEIADNNMPHEILYLPLIESSFQPDATSNLGAAGLWQFMTNSISEYDMKITEWLDERRDFWKSTEAAISKIKYNYAQLGDWTLAIAAFNCGLGKMLKSVKAAGTTDFWTLCEKGYMNQETINYIPKLLAISDIMSNRDKLGISIMTQEQPVQWTRIKLDRCIDIRLLAKECGIPQDTLIMGNTELKYYITPPVRTGYMLKVPVMYKEKVMDALDKSSKLSDFHLYRVQKGDTLSHLAQHYGISVEMIQSFNNIKPESLKVGSQLIIPVTKSDIKPYKSPTKLSEDWTPEEPAEKFSQEYTVQDGDNLWTIARKFNTDVNHLAYYNHIAANAVLSVGKKLKVPAN